MLDVAEHRPESAASRPGPDLGPGVGPESGPDGTGVCRLDRLHRFEAVNPWAARLLGLPEAELLGHCLWDRFPALRESELHRRCLALRPGTHAPNGSAPQDFLFHFVPLDRWYVIVASAVEPVGAVEIRFTDVTDAPGGISARIRAERLDAAAEAMGRLSHDFNNCLTVMMGNAEYLEEMLAGDAELSEAIRFVAQAAERAAALTGRVLQFARRRTAPAGETPLEAVMEGLASRLRPLAPGHRIEVAAEPGLPAALVDQAAIEAALHELARNALEAMPHGGTLRVTAQRVTDQRVATQPVAGPAFAEERVAITVADTGRGMEPAVLVRCVEPFVSTKDPEWGIGMGLSAVYGFAASHGGSLHLESRQGQGTRATLELPAGPRPAGEGADDWPGDGADPSAPAGPRRHVLLVEDDAAGRAGIARLLGSLGYAVTAVASAAEAMAALREDGPPPDLLLADVILPGGLDGARLVSEGRRLHPALPALLMSGYAAHPAGEAVQDNGIRLLPKPFRNADLARALSDELRDQRRP